MQQHTVHTPYPVGEVHFYTTEINGELILFDTGPLTNEGFECLRRQVDLSRLRHIFITHCHADHFGTVADLARHTDANILLPRRDAIMLRRREERLSHLEKLLCGYGFTREEVDGFRSIAEANNAFPAPTERFSVVEESEIPEALGISWLSCPGHSQSDLVFRVGNYAVTGDVLLRDIYQSPLLDVDADTFAGRFRNYDVYCSTILELAKLRDSRILPGHRYSVESVDDTIISYVKKMLKRAGQVKKLADVESVREVADQLFEAPLSDPFYTYLKVSEIVFLRDFLSDPGRLEESLKRIGLLAPVSAQFQSVVG